MAAQGTPMPTAALGTLAITLMARTDIFRREMGKAIAALKQFNAEVGKNKAVLVEIARATQASAKATSQAITAQTKAVATGSQKTRTEMRQTGKVADQENKKMLTRGKQQLGAVLSFQQGIAKFIKLNLRWFVVWRSLWFLWGKFTEGIKNLNVVMHETSLALRTGADDLENEIELMVKRNQLTSAAIRFTAQHTKSLRDYIKSFYYLTTAGLSWAVASQTIEVAMKTAIALDEDAIATTRTLTSLYNVFGKTLTDVRTPTEKMQKIAAILTATFKEQDIEMADYNKALTYVGALSATAGVSLETLVASLGVLGTHFVKSSKGGTALARSFARLLKYPERLAKVTGYAFDPEQPLQFEQAMRLVSERLREGAVEGKEFAVSTKIAGEMLDLLGLRGIRIITLAANFEKLADQIRKNTEATYDLVESMVDLVESDPTAQLKIFGNAISMNIVAMGKGIVQTQKFSYSLATLNKVLLKATYLSEDFGRALGLLLGSLSKVTAAFIAWKLAFPKVILGLKNIVVGAGGATVAASALSGAFFKGKAATIGFGSVFATLLKKFAGFKGVAVGMAAGLGKLIIYYKLLTGAIDAVGVAYDAMTGNYIKKEMKFVADQIFIQKGWLARIVSILDARNLAYRISSIPLMKQWENVKKSHEKSLEDEELTETEHARRMQEKAIEWWSVALGVEKKQLQKRFGLITEADEQLMAERIRLETDLQEKIRKVRQSALEYDLESLEQENQVRKAKGVEGTEIDEYFALKRWTILREFMDKMNDKYKTVYKVLRKTQKTALDRQLLDIETAAKEAERLYALLALARIREQFEVGSIESQILSDSMKALEDKTVQGITALNVTRWKANRRGLTELSALLAESKKKDLEIGKASAVTRLKAEEDAQKKLTDKIRQYASFQSGELIETGKKDLLVLNRNYEKRRLTIEEERDKITDSTEISNKTRSIVWKKYENSMIELQVQHEIERLNIIERWALKREEAQKKIDQQEYEVVDSKWRDKIEQFQKTHRLELKLIKEQREKVTEREVEGAENRERILADLLKKEIELNTNYENAIKALREKNGGDYLKYLLLLNKKKITEVQKGNQEEADSHSRLWLEIKSGLASASDTYITEIGTLSDSVQRIFQTMYQGIEEVLTASFMRMAGLEEEYGLESMALVNERLKESKRALRDQLEDGRISREQYYAELNELDRKYSDEIEKRQTGLVKTLSDLQKSLTKAVLAELSKRIVGSIALRIKEWIVEKGITTKSILLDMKAIAIKIYKSFASIPFGLGIPLAIAAIAAIWAGIKKFSKVKLARGGIFEGRQPAIIGEAGPEAVVPLTREGGRLVLSEQGRKIISPLLSLENRIPDLLQAVEGSRGLIQLSPMAAATLGARGTTGKTEQRVQLDVTFQGDTIDFSGSVPMINDMATIDKVYEEVWLPAKHRRIERLRETIAEVME